MANIPVFGAGFCSPHAVELAIFGTKGTFSIRDSGSHNVRFKVTKSISALHEIRALRDAAGNPIATLRKKIRTIHDRWDVFRGGSMEAKDKLFSVKKAAIFKSNVSFKVFLACNEDEKVCDLTVKGKDWENKRFAIYVGESSTSVAQVYEKLHAPNEFGVKVEANTDQAFVVAVIMILDAIYEKDPPPQHRKAALSDTALNVLTAFGGSS